MTLLCFVQAFISFAFMLTTPQEPETAGLLLMLISRLLR